MIRNYSDHAANERTFLAWVRTALAFMGFGLVVERFDLVLSSMRAIEADMPKVAIPKVAMHLPPREAGLAMILLGVLVLTISSHRYLHFKRLIARPERTEFRSSHSDLALVVIVLGIALFMLTYVVLQEF